MTPQEIESIVERSKNDHESKMIVGSEVRALASLALRGVEANSAMQAIVDDARGYGDDTIQARLGKCAVTAERFLAGLPLLVPTPDPASPGPAPAKVAGNDMESKANQVLEKARALALDAKSWTEFALAISHQETGLVAQAFTDPLERQAFYDSPQYKEVSALRLGVMLTRPIDARSAGTPARIRTLEADLAAMTQRAERAERYVAGQDCRSDFRTATEMRQALDSAKSALAAEREAVRVLAYDRVHGVADLIGAAVCQNPIAAAAVKAAGGTK